MIPVTDDKGHHRRGRKGGLLWRDGATTIELPRAAYPGDGAKGDEYLARKVNGDGTAGVKPKRNQKRDKKHEG